MFETLNRKNVCLVFAALSLIALGNSSSLAQCGVYFKRAKTWAFPVTKLNLDRAADMTGDGLPDLLASQDGSSWTRTQILIIPNLGNGNFGAALTTILPPAGQVLNFKYNPVHANNDNRPDLFVMLGDTSLPNTFRIYINNGDGTFTPGPTNSLGTSTSLVDLNNDGFGDYISRSGSETRYHLGNGDGSFAPLVSLGDHGGTTADFNGDGKIDFLHGTHLHLNNGNLTWGTIDIGPVFQGRTTWGMGDFNVDGKLDFMTTSTGTSGSLGFSVLTSTGAGFTVADYTVSTDPSWIGYPQVGNWSGNSAPEIVFQPRYQSQKIILINDGAGNFTQQTFNGRIDITTGQQSVNADFDNDGKTDRIQVTSDTTNQRLMLKDVTSFTFVKQVCNQTGESRIVDYDRSNSTDYSFWNPVTGDWSRRTNGTQEGPAVSTETVNWGLGSHGDIPTPGDFDGDGITDRAIYRNSTGVWYIRRSSDAGWFVMPFGLPGDKPVAADFDGDTVTDIAVWRPSDGNWYFWYMGTQQFAAVHFGSDGDKPVQADYDGDLKADIAVYRPSTGVWYYTKSSNNDFVAIQWGSSTDKPLPGDYDGDGKADLTVWRESGRVAYILRSYNSSLSYYWYGLPGDVFQVGDYDGDYVSDLAVFRPSDRSWWATPIFVWGLFTYGVEGAIPTSSLVKGD